MHVIVSGKHIKIGDSFKAYIENEIKTGVHKYFERAVTAHVVVSKTHHFFLVDIVVNEGTGNGVIIKSQDQDRDPYISFDHALVKIKKQLRRYKAKISNHHKTSVSEIIAKEGTKYVVPPLDYIEDEDDYLDFFSANIIEEKSSLIDYMTPNEAVMKMDMLNLPTLVFINIDSNTLNVIYYRKDGNISWIDTKIEVK